MPYLDFTLNNPKIHKYLEGSSDIAPIGELLYIHTHFIKDNFLSEIEVLINRTADLLLEHKANSGVATRLSYCASLLATQVHQISEETAPEILANIKQIYQICVKVIYKYENKDQEKQ